MQMLPALISLSTSLLFLVFLIVFFVYTCFLIYSSFKGSPYVPTKTAVLDKILKEAHFKKGMKVLELGCGDGRMLIHAVSQYGVTGYGVDINPIVLKQARWGARRLSGARIKFENKNLRDIDVGKYDIVYLFLLPQLLAKFAPKWQKESKKKTLFISHAFTIKRWEHLLEKTVSAKPYDTYFYRMK
ncbi:class I SAM-dependent methyltransferase [Candidatus Microgenomates bacterium]|nr:class I SAM-dependent methyltransferase [Candidatus Microgenomates bacterium]